MHIQINGKQIIGVDKDILRALVFSVCDRCTHKTVTHREDGCKCSFDFKGMDLCPCKRGYTSYLLLKDDNFVQEIIKEGILF